MIKNKKKNKKYNLLGNNSQNEIYVCLPQRIYQSKWGRKEKFRNMPDYYTFPTSRLFLTLVLAVCLTLSLLTDVKTWCPEAGLVECVIPMC